MSRSASRPTAPIDDRLLELLADEAVGELSVEDGVELERRLAASPGVDREQLVRIAALLDLSGLPRIEVPPADLRAKLSASAAAWSAQRRSAPVGGDRAIGRTVSAPMRGAAAERPVSAYPARSAGRRGWAVWGGWAVAAAVALAWLASIVGSVPPKIDGVRDGLAWLESQPGTISLPWQAGTDRTGGTVQGRVVWNDQAQSGFMVFTGLAANDPRVEQYQLWVFDGARDERFPVHGGVFDVRVEGSEVVVPIDPRLRIEDIKAFVVTVERPGGVWVSDRSRIAALAAVGG